MDAPRLIPRRFRKGCGRGELRNGPIFRYFGKRDSFANFADRRSVIHRYFPGNMPIFERYRICGPIEGEKAIFAVNKVP